MKTNQTQLNRRQALKSSACGFGTLALSHLLADSASADRGDDAHHPAKAKRVIFLFMAGGPSHIDLFDPKEKLAQYHGQPAPFKLPKLERTPPGNVQQSPFKFRKYGQAGLDVSELFPHIAKHADDLCVIRSMVTDNINHNGACLQMNTGEQTFSRPSMGSWLLYGLGSENQNLPGYLVIAPNQPAQGAPLWGSSFLPAKYQGTCVANMDRPIENLANTPAGLDRQRNQLDFVRELNRLHERQRRQESQLAARIASFELAFRMQREAPAAFDLGRESQSTRKLYGLDNKVTKTFGRQCLLARRMVERGVRYVQLYHNRSATASGCQIWDQHGNLKQGLINNCQASDLPISGLLTDLKQRGLLQDTLVIWGGEFGRTPTAEGKDGREHHPFGFTMWMAGGGVRSGLIHGSTDDFGWYAQRDKVHIHDLHATILHLMGLDHTRLTYRYAGRDYRLTDVYGRVVKEILA